MNSCRVSRKGSGVVFGQTALHVVDRSPKTTPDPVAYHFAQGVTVCSVVLLPDGQHLAIGDLHGGVGIWHAATGQPIQQFTGHEDIVYQLACSPDGKFLASTSKDGALMIWSIEP